MMVEIPEEAVTAAASALRWSGDTLTEMATAALTAAIPFLHVQGAVKTGERLPEAEKEITRYQQERDRWINYTVDLQRIIEALCDRRGLPEPISTARHHYDMAREYLSSRAGNAARILPALEPSSARERALGALRSAEQFIENGFEFGFIRKPDEGDTALETLPKIKAAIRALSSLDHADAGKVEGDGWLPIESAPKDTEEPYLCYSPGNKRAHNEYARYAHYHIDGFSERWPKGRNQYPEAPYTHWRPLPPAPSEGAE